MGKQAKAYRQRPVQHECTGYEALAAAIVLQAVEDWKEAKKKLDAAQSIPDKNARSSAISRHRNTMDEIEKFFFGKWYASICDIDPHLIMRKLRYGR